METQELRAISEVRSKAEMRLAETVERQPAWQGREICFSAVSGGISNANFRLRVVGEAHDFFVKIPGDGTEMFIDRCAAHEASLAAAATGYGAPVHAFDAGLGVEIFRFVEGWRASNNLDFQRSSVRINAAGALKAFNGQPRLALTKTVFDMIDEHVEQMRACHARAPDDFAFLMREYAAARAALEASGLDLVPCMNDTLAGNFMLGDADAVLLVDFEYASNNDRAYELALFFGEMFFTASQEAEVLESYLGRVDTRLAARISLYRALADLKWSAWAMIQAELSTIDFDYYKYGAWKYMRARRVIHNPKWPVWLRSC